MSAYANSLERAYADYAFDGTHSNTSLAVRSFLEELKPGFSALAVYEFLITTEDEVSIVWGRPWSVASVLFLSNRWIGMFCVSILNTIPLIPKVRTMS